MDVLRYSNDHQSEGGSRTCKGPQVQAEIKWSARQQLSSDGRVQEQEILQCTKVFELKTKSSRISVSMAFRLTASKRKNWARAIRRDEGVNFVIRRGSTFVCSRHFTAADYIEGSSRLKPGAVPTRFQWRNFPVPPHKPSSFERASCRWGVDGSRSQPADQVCMAPRSSSSIGSI
ncbi:hypothetical protein NFI96_021850 [Prochilodus magdalenae]|nr:hypothetical protein NFI96_021850 [Prochilodus magdalenae]